MLVLLILIWLSAPAQALGGSQTRSADGAIAAATVLVLGTKGSACSGTVIGPRLVLTAAHCAEGSSQLAIGWFEAGQPVLVPVTAMLRHPEAHTGSAVSVDLAVLRIGSVLPPHFRAVPIDGGETPHELG